MAWRRVGVPLLVASLLAAGLFAGRGSSAPADTPQLYRVRADPRLCPSPMCGGYFLVPVNASTTRCHDGVRRGACYVAEIGLDALPAASRGRARAALADPLVLAYGRQITFRFTAPQPLAAFAAQGVWRAAGTSGDPGGTIFRVVDTGLRCIRAPCFSFRATAANSGRSVQLSGVDLGAPGVTSASLRRAYGLLARGGVLVTGSFRANRDPGWPYEGRVLDATEVWLPA